jgi:hypothetical protein
LQTATGGGGGSAFGEGSVTGVAAMGGVATSILSVSDTMASFVSINASASGGDGGSTDIGTGGSANASASLSSTAASAIDVRANATGGSGGEATANGGTGGLGGTGTASAMGASTIGAQVTVSLSLTGGSGAISALVAGSAGRRIFSTLFPARRWDSLNWTRLLKAARAGRVTRDRPPALPARVEMRLSRSKSSTLRPHQ